MAALSVIVLTLNEEENLPDCLASLEPLEAELFVVDSGSTDRTAEIARKAGARWFEHGFEDYGRQRNWALRNLPLETEWVLNLDSDERLTPELAEEIRQVVGDVDDNRPVGYLLRRRTVFLGRWIRHGGHYPSHHLRLFRRGRGCCEDRRYDQHFIVDGPTGVLKHDFIDIVTADLDSWTKRHIRWAKLEAEEIAGRNGAGRRVEGKAGGNSIERKRWLREGPYARAPLFLRAFLYWFYRYVIRLGFLDGKEGLIFHFLQGFWYRFMVDVNLWDMRRGK